MDRAGLLCGHPESGGQVFALSGREVDSGAGTPNNFEQEPLC